MNNMGFSEQNEMDMAIVPKIDRAAFLVRLLEKRGIPL
jgi:hypothetical protein